MEQSGEELEKARELLRTFSSGMLVTRDEKGDMHARPMMVAEVDDRARVSFITSLGTQKVDEVLKCPRVGITLQNSGAFVAVSGVAEVIVDPDKKQQVWNRLSELWFAGPQDPGAGLITVVPDTVEYWDNRGLNSLKFVFQALVAKARGEDPEVDATQHGYVQLPT